MDHTLNVTYDLIEHAQRTPDATALVLPDREISYRTLDELIWRAAAYLHAAGARPGNVIAVTVKNPLVLACAMLGIARLGATILPIPNSATLTQRRVWTQAAQANLIVSDDPQHSDAQTPFLLFQSRSMRPKAAGAENLIDVRPEAPLVIILGSGSTGRRKLMPLRHSQSRVRSLLRHQGLAPISGDRWMSLSSLEFSGTFVFLTNIIQEGATFIFPNPVLEKTIDYCHRMRVTALRASVFHLENLLRTLPDTTENALGGLRILRVSGSNVTPSLRMRVLSRLSKNLHVVYGTNEIGGITSAPPSMVFGKPGSVGSIEPGVEMEIVDSDGNPVMRGIKGHIRVRSGGLIERYLGDDQATERAFREGWFYPGDLGVLEPDGQLIFLGRADDMMIVNGINIYPAEIERTLTAHPAIEDAAAFPLRHRIHQDVPICAVTLRAGARETEVSILAYAKEQLGFQSPRRIFVVSAIPRNVQGKLQRAEMMALIESQLTPKLAD